jgi:hypothetical protein
MRKAGLSSILLVMVVSFAAAQDVETASGAYMAVTTRTSFGINMDHPERFGLRTEFPRLGLYYNMAPWQKVSNAVKSPKPVGFVELYLDALNVRFTNGTYPDDNNPGQTMGLGFNDSASRPTGYFGPFYIYGMQSGIIFNDDILQLAAGGNDDFWKPWNRSLAFLNDKLADSWAYLDTRVQYRRDLVSTMGIDTQSETNYWTYSSQNTPMDSLSLLASGAMIGLQHADASFAYMVKLATQYDYTFVNVTPTNMNGLAFGFDYAVTPAALPGLRALGSITAQYEYGADKEADPVFSGLKIGYDVPIRGLRDVSVEPYAGYDVRFGVPEGFSGQVKIAHEIAAGTTVHWPGQGGWGYDYLQSRSGVVYPGLTLAYDLFVPDTGGAVQHNLLVTLREDSGDAGMLLGIGSEAVLQYFDFTNTANAKALASLYVDYTVKNVVGGNLIAWTKIFFDYIPASSACNLKVDAGVKLAEAISNAVIGVIWDSGGLLAAGAPPVFGYVKMYVEVSL